MNKMDAFAVGFFVGIFAAFVAFALIPDYSPPEPVPEVASVEAAAHTEPNYIIMNVSAYDAGPCCCGKYADGITASGKPAVGRICAAPPEYAFGTVLDVESYGEYVVQDRGGAITGNKLDLLFEDKGDISGHQRALEFGRKPLKVKVKARMESVK